MTIAKSNLQSELPAAADIGLRSRPNTLFLADHIGAQLVTAVALVLSDVLAFTLVFVAIAALLSWFGIFPTLWITQSSGVIQDAVFGTSVSGLIAYFALCGHYTHRMSFAAEIRLLACSSLFGFSLSVMFVVVVPGSYIYLGLLVVWMLFPFLALCGRKLVRWALKRAGLPQVRMIVVGRSGDVDRVLPSLTDNAGFDCEVAHVMHLEACLDNVPSFCSWHSVVQQYHADLVIVCDDIAGSVALDVVSALAKEGVPFAVAAYAVELQPSTSRRIDLVDSDVTQLSYRNQMATPSGQLSKIVLDLLIASVCIVTMLPVLLIIAVLVKSDGGPLLFGHTRVGFRGRPFQCLKFRSMIVDSETVLLRLLENNQQARAEWDETQKLRHDPRVTTIGRFLRASSLDELPQLLNVLRLEMSLVGPRPIVAAEVPRYGENIKYYYQTRPGLTGLWQISGRSSTGYRQRVEFDRRYVRNWTIWQDLAILAKTVPAVLKRRGAY